MKEAFQALCGIIEDDAFLKITGAADKPLQLIRRFKNERNPNVAVTVELLTTGIDVQEICNLVFRRWVNSHILFDQMLGRATRLCDEIGKDTFRIFDAVAGMTPDAFQAELRQMSLTEVAACFTVHPPLGEILDRKGDGDVPTVLISQHEDKLRSVKHGCGNATRPEDYLDEFSAFLRSRDNDIPALLTVLTRPRELTRKELRQLALDLDRAGLSEANLATAWREMTNQEIAAGIVGHMRRAALGDPLVPFRERVERALQQFLASKSWTTPQRQWLQKIAAQTKVNWLVDREALDEPDLLFRREGGGFARRDRLFDGQLEQVLEAFNDSLWQPAA